MTMRGFIKLTDGNRQKKKSMLITGIIVLLSIGPSASRAILDGDDDCGGCQNGASCVRDLHEPYVFCNCLLPFKGSLCETRTCQDGRECLNGSECIFDGYHHQCDCSTTTDKKKYYAGLKCEHESTELCAFSESVSKLDYCTNGGICKLRVDGTNSA